MANGFLSGIYVCPVAGEQMQRVAKVEAVAGRGLVGDRYHNAAGSWNKGKPGKRQVTLISARSFYYSKNFNHAESRRNLIVHGIELMWHIGREFQIGRARFGGLKYCDPCDRPDNLLGRKPTFREEFFDWAGLIAEVTVSGIIRVGDPIIPARRNSPLGTIEEELHRVGHEIPHH